MRPRSPGTHACTRRPQSGVSAGDRLWFVWTRSCRTRRGRDVLPNNAHSDARSQLKNISYAAVFLGLAYCLASREDKDAGGLSANHAVPEADKCDRLHSVDVAWPKASIPPSKRGSHHPPYATSQWPDLRYVGAGSSGRILSGPLARRRSFTVT